MSPGPLPGATPEGHVRGLERWVDPVSFDTVFWVAPPGTTAVLEVTGQGTDAAELQWSTRCAEIPSTRAVVLVDGPGDEDPTADFGTAHSAAEAVAGFVTDRTGVEAGPIEVLVFRPDADHEPWPEPVPSTGGASFRFRHRGGADVYVALALPASTVPAPTSPAPTPTTTPGEA